MRQSGARFWKPETDYELKDERNLWTGESEGIQHLVFVTWWKAGKLKKTFVQHSANSKGKERTKGAGNTKFRLPRLSQ